MYSEKATKFCEISTVDLSYVVPVKYTVEISQNFVAFSEYMNFIVEADVLYVYSNNEIKIESSKIWFWRQSAWKSLLMNFNFLVSNIATTMRCHTGTLYSKLFSH